MNYLKQLDETSRPTRLQVPEGACDCHSHVFGDPAIYPFVAERSYTPPPAAPAEYRRMLDTIGFTRAVIVQPSVYGFDNRCTLDGVAEMGLDRTRAIVQISGNESAAELKAMDERGARGIRFITVAKGGTSLDLLKSAAGAIAPLGWHVQMYLSSDLIVKMADTILSLPVDVVIDHMGHITTDSSAEECDAVFRLLDSGRVWMKLSSYRVSHRGAPYLDVKPIAEEYLRRAPDRCVYGSDWPHPNLTEFMPDDGPLIDLLADWAPDEVVRRKLLVDNPARLYRF
ncbi:putative TIM-barrel fold metal-dependent hydrolase [Mesorhizobium sp. J18]|uniref:amidohydrolase family protein n=1 Tax=Mesorhizobium sp. J18 TaxID=935263 RepID=UPI001199112F|nr:amidohydrolase family protein [Mesorhizobium sp. J18]TWG96398.1 putative TIM-barrel fold metal-dependent hydrolase [Mesorhizobium sp. J18]